MYMRSIGHALLTVVFLTVRDPPYEHSAHAVTMAQNIPLSVNILEFLTESLSKFYFVT